MDSKGKSSPRRVDAAEMTLLRQMNVILIGAFVPDTARSLMHLLGQWHHLDLGLGVENYPIINALHILRTIIMLGNRELIQFSRI